ncbi:hypothetical protein M8C21_012805, partial [Ambrosia artemisiifolia]
KHEILKQHKYRRAFLFPPLPCFFPENRIIIRIMSDQIAKGEDFEKQADKKLRDWKLFGSKHEDAADLYEKAANFYKIGKSWPFLRGPSWGSKVTFTTGWQANGELDSKHEAANAYADAECIARLEQALDLYMEIGRLKCPKCDRYQKAIEIYEDIARQALSNNLLKYGVKGHLLNAGICQLCKGDDVAVTNALEKYQDMDPTFAGTREYRLMADLAASIEEEDVEKFTEAIKEFDSMTKLDAWKTTLLLRVKDLLKAKEMEEDDLT